MIQYEAPAVEMEVSHEDVQREVHYAGGLTIIPQ